MLYDENQVEGQQLGELFVPLFSPRGSYKKMSEETVFFQFLVSAVTPYCAQLGVLCPSMSSNTSTVLYYCYERTCTPLSIEFLCFLVVDFFGSGKYLLNIASKSFLWQFTAFKECVKFIIQGS